MHFRTCLISAILATCIVIPALPLYLRAQSTGNDEKMAAAEIPEAPQPAAGFSVSTEQLAQVQPGEAPSSAASGSSSSQPDAQQPDEDKGKSLTAEEQLKQQVGSPGTELEFAL